jgi:hypothetical protein
MVDPGLQVETQNIIDLLLSWLPARRFAGLDAISRLEPDARLEIEKARLLRSAHERKSYTPPRWHAALTLLAMCFVYAVSQSPVLMLVMLVLSVWIGCVQRRRANVLEESLAMVVAQASDNRLVPWLLIHMQRFRGASRADSREYPELIDAVERLLPEVALEDIENWEPEARRALVSLLDGAPESAKVTIEVLRLAPFCGDNETLGHISALAAEYEWGGTIPAHMCVPLNRAARASEVALRDSLERQRRAAELLRPSDLSQEQERSEMLRPATIGSRVPDNELVRPELPAEERASREAHY